MASLNFILISDSVEVERHLKHQLDSAGEFYTLERVGYNNAPKVLASKKYDRIFAALCERNLREQANYLVALGKTSTPVTVLTVDRASSSAMVKLRQHSPNLESISPKELQNNNDLIGAFFSFSIEQQREHRLRSEFRAKEDTEQWKKLARLEVTVGNLEVGMQKMENYFYGCTTPDGRENSVLSAVSWTFKNQEEFDRMRLELRDLNALLKDVRSDFIDYVQKSETQKATSWQTKLAVGVALLGAVTSLLSAFIPHLVPVSDAKARVEARR